MRLAPAPAEIQKARVAPRLFAQQEIELLLVGRASRLRTAVHTEFVRRRNVRGLRIQQALMVGSQAQLDERPGIGRQLGLPAIGGLVAGQGVAGGRVPGAGRLAAKVMLANEGALNFRGALLVDAALTVGAGRALRGRTCWSDGKRKNASW